MSPTAAQHTQRRGSKIPHTPLPARARSRRPQPATPLARAYKIQSQVGNAAMAHSLSDQPDKQSVLPEESSPEFSTNNRLEGTDLPELRSQFKEIHRHKRSSTATPGSPELDEDGLQQEPPRHSALETTRSAPFRAVPERSEKSDDQFRSSSPEDKVGPSIGETQEAAGGEPEIFTPQDTVSGPQEPDAAQPAEEEQKGKPAKALDGQGTGRGLSKFATGPAEAVASAVEQGSSSAAASGGEAGPAPAAPQISAEDPGEIIQQLAEAPPTVAAEVYDQAQIASRVALAKQQKDVAAGLPVITAPTGLPARAQETNHAETGEVAAEPSAEALPQATGQTPPAEETRYDSQVAEAPPAPPATPTLLPGGGSEAADSELSREARSELDSVGMDVDQISTSAGPPPPVNMTGEADPSQLEDFQDASVTDVQAGKEQAASEISQDFGEHDIYPEPTNEKLGGGVVLSSPGMRGARGTKQPALPPEAVAGLNQSLGPTLKQRISEQGETYGAGKTKFDTDVAQARGNADDEIAALEDEARKKQLEAQGTVAADVAQQRKQWKTELDQVEKDAVVKTRDATKAQREKIAQEKSKGEEKAAQALKDAEQKAAVEKQKTHEEAGQKKKEAKKKSGGFWGWVKSAASALIDGLKKAFNFIWDNLRKLVRGIFEVAKKIVLGVIELARMAIVGLIKGLGLILKGIVTVALAAFPNIARKVRGYIDKAVDSAVSAVNTAAEWLKKGVAAVLDFLAKTVDKLLGLIQSIYNGIFTVIGMLIRGEFGELMRRLGNLVTAAKESPAQFETAAYEELLGGDLDKPLSPMELAQAGEKPPSPAGPQPAPGTATAEPLPKSPWSTENVGVDAVESNMQLSPAMSQELLERTGGNGTVELGETEEKSRTMNSIVSEVTRPQEEGKEEAEPQYPPDGLTPGRRAEIKWKLMKEGLSHWWAENRTKIILGAVAAILGAVALIVVTGGAILGAVGTIMSVLGPFFIGATIAMIGERVHDYVTQSWDGKVEAGAKSLAKAMAAGAIELISWLTFKAGGAVLKGAKAVAKGAVRVAGVVARGVARVIRAGIGFIVKAGKFLFKGIAGTGLGKRIIRLAEFGEQLLQRMRFRKFRILLSGLHFQLEGFINPWILLADGTIEQVNFKGKAKLGEVRVGRNASGEAVEGIVVGIKDTKPSSLVQDLRAKAGDVSRLAENKALYEDLISKTLKERRALVAAADKLGFASTTEEMRAAVQGKKYVDPRDNKLKPSPAGEPMEPDHIFPVEQITKLPGFDKLTPNQKKAIIHDLAELNNIQALPKSLNRSKGGKLASEWISALGEKVHPDYVRNLTDAQRDAKQRIMEQIVKGIEENRTKGILP